jgi:hypothetical protein
MVNDFNQICLVSGIDINSFEPISSSNEHVSDNAYKKLKLIVQVLNDGWVCDWKNDKQIKHYPYFKYDPFMDKFIMYKVGSYCNGPVAGSRLVFKSKELAEFVAINFINIYNDWFNYVG